MMAETTEALLRQALVNLIEGCWQLWGDYENCEDCTDIAQTEDRPCQVHNSQAFYGAIHAAEEACGPCPCGHLRSQHHDEESIACRECKCKRFELREAQSSSLPETETPLRDIVTRLDAQPHDPPCPYSTSNIALKAQYGCLCWIGKATDFIEGALSDEPLQEMPPAPRAGLQGLWPEVCVQRAFVDGVAWQLWRLRGVTLWSQERDEAEAEAVKRFGETAPRAELDLPALAAQFRRMANECLPNGEGYQAFTYCVDAVIEIMARNPPLHPPPDGRAPATPEDARSSITPGQIAPKTSSEPVSSPSAPAPRAGAWQTVELTDEMCAQMVNECRRAVERVMEDAGSMGFTLAQKLGLAKSAQGETVRSYLYQAGVLPLPPDTQ